MDEARKFKGNNEDQAWVLFACAALTMLNSAVTPKTAATHSAAHADALLAEFRARRPA